jgi:uncharacterized protein YjbJ (UPF0337 family)
MNEDTLKGQWNQLKGKVREKWGMLTNDDLNVIQGQSTQLVGRIQERYGIARDEAERQVKDWLREAKEPTPTR